MDRDAHDPELAEDLIGVTSARLLATGVPREERAGALRLLSILATLADGDLRVRRPLAMVASEFDLPTPDVDHWLDDLVAVGAVEVVGDAIVVGGREPSRHVAITLHDFLDNAAELDAPRRRTRTSLLRPSAALAAAAAIVALAMVGPAFLDDPSTSVSNTRDVGERRPTLTTDAAPSTSGTSASGAGRTATSVSERDRSSPDPTDGVGPLGPIVASTTTTVTLPCPVGTPLLEVLGTVAGTDNVLLVDGAAHNPTSHDLSIHTFTLRVVVGDEVTELPGTSEPLLVPAGRTTAWQARLPVVAPTGTVVEAALGRWQWEGLDAAAPCPTP